MNNNIPLREKAHSLRRVALHRPGLVTGVVVLSIFAALLEAIGLSFLIPIIEVAQGGSKSPGGIGDVFVKVYQVLGIPFTLEYIVLGIGVVMGARYSSSFFVSWLVTVLRTDYVRHLQTRAFDQALDAEVAYFDERGSDDILNAIVTQSRYAGQAIQRIVEIVEQSIISLMYVVIALMIAPVLTIASGVVLGGVILFFRSRLESGYLVGNRVAAANQRVQSNVQAGMQGIRDVKLFGMRDELFEDFNESVDQFRDATVRLRRNEAALEHFYQFAAAITVFGLIYIALTYASLTLASLGLFLFAMFRLAPRLSTLNNLVYQAEGDLPHLIRTQNFLDELSIRSESTVGSVEVSPPIREVVFDDISFTYPAGEQVLDDVTFSFQRGDFVAFVGPSGAGKSTLVSLLTRLYEPDVGRITADGTPIERFPLREWRDRVSVVRQQPHIFNETLRYNLTIGRQDVSDEELERVCEVARVTEFLDELPNRYDTVLGDDGVRLSGGQRQRVAIARALLEDSDILVLDEATSDLDTELEQQVHDAVEQLDRDYAMLVIAHRLSTVVNADQIYVMEDGSVIESGTHQELMERETRYASLYADPTESPTQTS